MKLVVASSLLCLAVAQTMTTFASTSTVGAPTRKPKKTAKVLAPTFAPFMAAAGAPTFAPFPGSTAQFSAASQPTFSPFLPSSSFATATQTSFPAIGQASFSAAGQTGFSSGFSSSFPQSPVSATGLNSAWQTLFDPNQFRSYNMEISPTNLALMNQDPKKELKVHCTVTTDYQTPQARTYSSNNLGCGYKGSVGALRICFDAYGKFSPDDCRKASYKIDANYFDKNSQEEIAGVHHLMFHGAPADWSMMGERLAFELLHGWGIIAPSAVHSSLYQNGQFLGVFVFVSPIDEEFTQKYFGNDYNQGRGALYKESWFNPVHMASLSEQHYAGKNEDAFMNQIEAAMLATPLDQQSATQFFNTYFDVDSLVDVTAANTVLGNTDDWRQRHNMYWYIRDDASGKKAVLIPWDYDRLNDAGADQRGALKGRPWWDPATRTNCNTPLRSAAARGAIKGGSDPMQVAYWTDIFLATPPDVEQPVSCDRITQLMELALGSRIRARTREFAATINRASMQANIQTWTNQIQAAIARDPDGPRYSDMTNEQRLLIDAIVTASQKAVTQANAGDSGISLPSPASSSSNFVPKTTSSSFVPKTSSGGGQYKVGEVLSSTFTPVNPAFASAFASVSGSGGYVPKSTSTTNTGFSSSTFPSSSASSSSSSSFSQFQFQPASSSSSFSSFSTPSASSFSSASPAFSSSSSFSFPASFAPAASSSFSGSAWGR